MYLVGADVKFRLAPFIAVIICVANSALAGPDIRGDPAPDLQLQRQLDPHAIVLLPVRVSDSTDTRDLDLATEFYDQFLAVLRAVPNLHVIDPDLVAPYVESELLDTEIAQQLGAANVVTIRVRRGDWGTSLSVGFEPVQSASGFSTGMTFHRDFDFEGQPHRIARLIEHEIFPERAPDRSEEAFAARAIVLDFSRSDKDRNEALRKVAGPRSGSDPPRYMPAGVKALSGEVALAAAQLASQSEDPGVRYGVWRMMAGVGDPTLIEPLLLALHNDTNRMVRVQAARTLIDFSDDSRIREFLQIAAQNDSDESVRDAARWSLLSPEERWGERRQSAMDSTLSERERKMEFHRLKSSHYGKRMPIDEELRRSLISFARNASSSETRSYLWWGLANMCGPEIVEPMLSALVEEPHEDVRHTLVSMLAVPFMDEPGVYEALVQAQETDDSQLVSKKAEEELRESED